MQFTNEEQANILSSFETMLTECHCCRDPKNVDRIRKAFEFANKAHYPIRRKSGEPYILHPINVAQICGSELNLGTTSMIAALLHDVVEDTEYTIEDIEQEFGEEVASIVGSLTKINETISVSDSLQSENFKRILLAMTQDIRVILVKLADRLHNVRTLEFISRPKQLKIASETLYVFAPIAHILGLFAIKTELEDIAFRIKEPAKYDKISEKLANTDKQRTNFINKFALPIEMRLIEEKYDYDLKGRPKSIYSIAQKMEKKSVTFEEVYDIFAIRIVFDPKSEKGSEKDQCYQIYSIITDYYTPHPDRLRNWIETPRKNGYEALHSTVMGPEGRWVEVQIRTKRMDEIAEHGCAAHFKYKGNKINENNLETRLAAIREIMNNDNDLDATEIVEMIKSSFTSSEVIVFTPKGESLTFPKGASALDFAYVVHTDIGHHAISAKVNHQIKPLSYKLRSGDQIEIITSKEQTPQRKWKEIAKTVLAQKKLKTYWSQELEKQAEIGKKVLERLLAELKLTITPRIIEKLKAHFEMPQNQNDKYVFEQVALGELNLDSLKKALRQNTDEKKVSFWTFRRNSSKKKAEQNVPAKSDFILADCCHPIPGDKVVGYEIEKDKIIIHQIRCPEVDKLSSQHGNKIIKEVDWLKKEETAFLVKIKLTGVDRMGMVNDITNVLSAELSINIRAINFYSHDNIFDGEIALYVKSNQDLKAMIAKLKKIKNVDKIVRLMT